MDQRQNSSDLADRESEILQLNNDIHVSFAAVIKAVLFVLDLREQKLAVDIVADRADLDIVFPGKFTDLQKGIPPLPVYFTLSGKSCQL